MTAESPPEPEAEPTPEDPADDREEDTAGDAAPRPRRWSTRVRGWILQAVLVAAVFAGVQAFQRRNLLDETLSAPSFELQKLGGGTVSTSQLQGKRVLLHFWATWCGVCRREFGALNAVQRNLAKDEVLLTIVEDGDDLRKLTAFVKEHDIRYPIAIATPEVIRAFKISAFPTNYVLDKRGHITGRDVGMSTRWGLSTRLGCSGQ